MTTPEELEELEEVSPGPALDPSERDVEAPVEDAYEQAIPAEPEAVEEEIHRGLEVNEYDAVEQAHVVIMDEDYR